MEGRYYETSGPGRPPTAVQEPPEPTGWAYITLTSGERVECRLVALSDTLWEAHPVRALTDLDRVASAGSSCPAKVKIRFVL